MPVQTPIYQQRTSAQGPLGPGPQGDRGASGIVALGQQLESDFEEREHHEAMRTVSQHMSELRLAVEEDYLAAEQNAAAEPESFADNALRAYDKRRAEISKKIASPRARAIFADHADETLRADIGVRALRTQHAQGIAVRQVQATEGLGRLEAAVEHNPDSLPMVLAEYQSLILATGMDPATLAAERVRSADELTEAAGRGKAKRDPLDALAKLADPTPDDPLFVMLSADARHRLEVYAKAQLVEQRTNQVMAGYERSTADGLAAVADLGKSGIAPELLAEISAQVNHRQSLLRGQRREEHVEELTELGRALSTDTAGKRAEEITERLYKVGAFSADDYARTLGMIDANILRRAREGAGVAEVEKALAAGLPLDPSDPDHRKVVSSYFGKMTSGLAPGSEPWLVTARAIANTTRMLPEQPLQWTRQALRSPDPAIAANAAQFYGSIAAGVPDAVSGFDDKTRSFAHLVNSMIEVGTNPAKAVEIARENVFAVPEPVMKARAKAWSDNGRASLVGTSSSALANLIDRDLDPGWFSSEPAATDARASHHPDARRLEPDFRTLTEKYFLNSGDIEQARELAWSDIKRVYGRSDVNGYPQLMAFPPERAGVTRAEILAGAEELLKAHPQADGTTAADVLLVPDALTLRGVSDVLAGRLVRPSYAVIGKSNEPLLDAAGRQIRFEIPSGEEITKRIRASEAAAEAAAREQIEAARLKRDRLRQLRENPVDLSSGY